jgi:hypothetical protein
MENWRVLDSKYKYTGRRLILLVDQDSATAMKKTGCKTYTRLSEGTFKVFSNPDADQDGGQATVVESQTVEPGTKGKGAGSSTASKTREKQLEEDPVEPMACGTSSLQTADKGLLQNLNPWLWRAIKGGSNPQMYFFK